MQEPVHKREKNVDEDSVFRFILNQIETVPHLEALLLLFGSSPQKWGEVEVSERLFVDGQRTHLDHAGLAQRQLIAAEALQYWYERGNEERDRLVESVAIVYRRDLVRVSNLIHSKAPTAVREFARAFKFTKERE